ncbi:MAG: ankyrin repeat domain-containing protein [Oscillospiraceae bacterium]|jgi:hypothetical protein|nr:ankyrin repeat domain-containing protein [Oscillospiraceae bacterium]
MRIRAWLCALPLVCALAGCAVAPGFRTPADERLYRAIENGGSVRSAEDAVTDGASVDDMPRGRLIGINMVEFAAANGRDDIALLLIERGADVNYKSSILEETLLMRFAKDCKIGLVRALLERGAQIDARNRVRDTALEYACRADETHTEAEVAAVVEVLLGHGAAITRATLNAALSGYSGRGDADGRYALLKQVAETLRAAGESVTLTPELEAATERAGAPLTVFPAAPALADADANGCGCAACGVTRETA